MNCGCGLEARLDGAVGVLCPAGHRTWTFTPPARWQPGRCPDGAHNAKPMVDIGGGVWWCGDTREPGPHYVTVAPQQPKGVTHCSPSSLAVARQCLHRYRCEYVMRHRPPSGVEAVRGTLSHRVLELLAAEPDGERDGCRARKLANQEWPAFRETPDFQQLGLTAAECRTFTGEAIAAVDRALELWPLNGRDIIGAETRFDLTINGIQVRGVIDLVERPSDPVLRRDDIHVFVTDYKSGRPPLSVGRQAKWDRKLWHPAAGPPPAEPEHDSEADKLIQAHIYNAAARQMFEVPNQRQVAAQLLYIGPDVAVLHAPGEHTRQTIDQVKTTWRSIQQAEEDGWWPATVGPLCGYCPHMIWDNGDGTHEFCGPGLRYAFNRLDSEWGWTKYGTNEPVPAAVTIRQLDPDTRRAARQAADDAAPPGRPS